MKGIEMTAEASERPSVELDIEKLVVSLMGEIKNSTRGFYFDELGRQPAVTIPKVSPNLRNQVDGAYDPKYISIGPLHRHKEALMPTEPSLKPRYLADFLNRVPNRDGQETVRVCVGAVSRCEVQARACYPKDVTASLTPEQLVMILVLDGCFLIEYMKKYELGELTGSDYRLRHDLLLLENQIPFFVLETLSRIGLFDLHLLALNFVDRKWTSFLEGVNVYHLLHLSHAYHAYLYDCEGKGLLRNQRTSDDVDGADEAQKTFPCAWELLELGIDVVKQRKRVPLFSVSLENGVLRIPPLAIDNGTITHFLNMVAFEQQIGADDAGNINSTKRGNMHTEHIFTGLMSYIMRTNSDLEQQISADDAGNINSTKRGNMHTEHIFTDYAVLMSYIMRTNSDLELLEKRGILQRDPSFTREKVIEVFSKIREHASLDYEQHSFADLFRNIKVLTTSRWRMHKAIMIRDLKKVLPGFMENPFVMIPLVISGFFLCFTGIQTCVSVLDYIHPRSKN